jgi:hypothetical protein
VSYALSLRKTLQMYALKQIGIKKMLKMIYLVNP